MVRGKGHLKSHIPRCVSRERDSQKRVQGTLCQHGYGSTASFHRLLLCCFWDSWWQIVKDVEAVVTIWGCCEWHWPSLSYWSGFVLISSPLLLCSFPHFVTFSPCLGLKPTSSNFESEWKCYSFNNVQLSAIPRTVACQAPLSMEFSRQEYWSG